MKYNININVLKCKEWGLTLRQGSILDVFINLNNWSICKTIGSENFYYLSINKILEEIPILGISEKSVYRDINDIIKKDIIKRKIIDNKPFYTITSKGKEYLFTKESLTSENEVSHQGEGGVSPVRDYNITNNKITKDIIEYLNKKTKKSFRYQSKKTQDKIKARIKEGFNLDDFMQVIDTKCEEWMNDKKMSQYLRPETLFGNKFEGYLNQNPKKKKIDVTSNDFLF